jgi:hypothetical protein
VGYAPGDSFETVFGVSATGSPSLLDGLKANGGGENALMRHAVAALLNAAAGSGVDYGFTTAQVIAMVQAAYADGDFEAYKNMFAAENDQDCPLN